ncbi:MAG: UPF0280 family protein [Methanobrevibacter sp.]|jgi:ApbE superfamily uncharacterized protein (UPF0280 family)|nr:UPF0280 family protein [Candidatus Methanovirga aequatorialis]
MFKKSLNLEETRLSIVSDIKLDFLREFVISKREELKNYISNHHTFFNSHRPVYIDDEKIDIVRIMAEAGEIANVGPMASVAGTISGLAVEELIKNSSKFSIVNNGGDISFINKDRKVVCGIYSGNSSLSAELGLEFKPQKSVIGLCTSSGTVGYSFSYGRSDSVSVVANKSSVADAIATAIANDVKGDEDSEAVENGLNTALRFEDHIIGVLIVLGDSIATFGKLPKLVSLKKGDSLEFKDDTIV